MSQLKPFLFLVCIFLSGAVCQNYSVTPIRTSSGLYYEKIGEVLLSNSNWQLVTSVDYEAYLLFYEYLFQKADEIHTFCQTFKLSTCWERYNSIQQNLDEITNTDEAMANFLGVQSKRRVKRFWGAIGNFLKNVGGFVARTIFGGGSRNVDLSAYDRAIGDLQNGQRALANEVQLQRTIFMIDSERKNFEINRLSQEQGDIQNKLASLEGSFEKDTVEKEKEIKELKGALSEVKEKIKAQKEEQRKLNGRVNDIEKNLDNVNKKIKVIKDAIDKNAQDINKLQIINSLKDISDNFVLLMNQFRTEQLTLFGVIKNANRGLLDPYILTPATLIEMLVEIQQHLPEGSKFPFYPSIANSKNLYNIIKPSIYLFDYKVIFILNIPLVYSKTFNLHKMTSLPAPVGDNKYVFILPQRPFIIIDNNYQDYMLMSKDNFEDCSELENTKHICQQTEEILHSQNSDECEVNLFKSVRQIPETCDARIMSLNKPMFLQLQRAKSWIYVVPGIENIIIDCGRNRTTTPFQGTGFLHVNGECSVTTNNFQLRPLTTFTNPVESEFSPPLNLTDFIDLAQFDEIEMKSMKSIQIIFPYDFKKLDAVSCKIAEKEVDMTALYCILPILIVLICVIGYLIYKKKNSLKTYHGIRNFINSRRQSVTRPEGYLDPVQSSDPEHIKMRIQVKNRNDIKNITVHESPSKTDPDSEYLTVRFKVKKEQDVPVSCQKVNENVPVPREKVNKAPVSREKANKAPVSRKKDKASVSREKVILNNLCTPENNLPSKMNTEDQYLAELRKFKPNINK